ARQPASKKPKLWHVTAGILVYSAADSRAHLEKNVVAQSAEQEIRAPVMDLYFMRSEKGAPVPGGSSSSTAPTGAQRISRAMATESLTTSNWRSVRVKLSGCLARTAQERRQRFTFLSVSPGQTPAACCSTATKSPTCPCISGREVASAIFLRNPRSFGNLRAKRICSRCWKPSLLRRSSSAIGWRSCSSKWGWKRSERVKLTRSRAGNDAASKLPVP